jgi:hypothetical protein
MEKFTEYYKKAAFESLGIVKKHNRRKYLRIWDGQVKQLM